MPRMASYMSDPSVLRASCLVARRYLHLWFAASQTMPSFIWTGGGDADLWEYNFIHVVFTCLCVFIFVFLFVLSYWSLLPIPIYTNISVHFVFLYAHVQHQAI